MPGEKEEFIQTMRNNNDNLNNVIFGIWPIVEALREAKPFNKIMIQKGNTSEELEEIYALAKEQNVPIQSVPPQKLARITRKNHQGVIGYTSPIEFLDIEEVLTGIFESGETPFIVCLDKITDVRNFGAICRTAEAAGVNAILIPEKEAAQIGADAIKTSAGAIFNLKICRSKAFIKAVQYIKDSGVKIVCCTEKSSQHYKEGKYDGPIALVMGSEDNGVSPSIIQISDYNAMIPMKGKTGSLNVSVAAGILLYEMSEQH